ncbi:protein PET100 homolog, mitochondrial [Hyalella azteca]|uniref:Protein PET100 homolog, mitochondrial n=1 Tax=Hyalella azteca TaxID=294128 RepID=A0A8B7NP14_HYAAZ|nr:protein PET100 homolog, mitochondrial [Hyalella azteca]
MGNWQLEVARMAIYMTFPVAAFYIFNQPQWFEQETIEKKRQIFRPTSRENAEMLAGCIKTLQEKEERELLESLSNNSSN